MVPAAELGREAGPRLQETVTQGTGPDVGWKEKFLSG